MGKETHGWRLPRFQAAGKRGRELPSRGPARRGAGACAREPGGPCTSVRPPLPYGETLTTSQSRRCLLGGSFRQAQILPPHLGGCLPKSKPLAPGEEGPGVGRGARVATVPPPSLEERPPDRLQAQCGVAGWPPATQLYYLTFCKTTGSQPIFSPRHRTQSKKPTAHVNAERGNLSSGPSPESLARAPRRRVSPAPAARTEPGGRHSPVQLGACRWDGGASGEGRAGNSLGSKGKEGLEIPRSFLLSSFCLLRGFVP